MGEILRFASSGGISIVAESFGTPSERTALLAHGGGQTRHAWGATARSLAKRGWHALAIDQRGHGDSGWSSDGDYSLELFAGDLLTIADSQAVPPVLVGASLGGLAGLLAQGEMVPAGRRGFSALVLVDVTPTVERDGVERIRGFMTAYMEQGFASLEEAAEAIATYLPHRPAPRSLEGLRKNLRLGKDGRYRWHWDPSFVRGRPVGDFMRTYSERLKRAAEAIAVPTLLVRGARSEVVSDEGVREFLALMPTAKHVDIRNAGHMVAGDENDSFSGAVLDFLAGLGAGPAG